MENIGFEVLTDDSVGNLVIAEDCEADNQQCTNHNAARLDMQQQPDQVSSENHAAARPSGREEQNCFPTTATYVGQGTELQIPQNSTNMYGESATTGDQSTVEDGFLPLSCNPGGSLTSLASKLQQARQRVQAKIHENTSPVPEPSPPKELVVTVKNLRKQLCEPKTQQSHGGSRARNWHHESVGDHSDTAYKHMPLSEELVKDLDTKRNSTDLVREWLFSSCAEFQNSYYEPLASASPKKGGLKSKRSKNAQVQESLSQPAGDANLDVHIPRKHKCPDCNYETDNKSHLRRHESTVHNAAKPFHCYACMKEFTRSEKVRSHFLKCHPDMEYNNRLIRKEKSDDTVQPYQNGQMTVSLSESHIPFQEGIKNRLQMDASCSESKVQATAGQLGMEVAASFVKQTTEEESARTLLKDRKFQCPLCSYAGKDSWHLKRHISDVHNGEKQFKCPKCDYATSRKHRLISHMKGHGELSCLYCNFSSINLDLYMLHLKDCARKNREKTYTCDYCGDKFCNRKMYATHLSEKHEVTLYQCELCPFTAEYPVLMQYHKQIHAGTRDLTCPICTKACVDHEQLSSHLQQSHGNAQNGSDYSCGDCDFKTSYRFVMKNHQKKHRGSEMFTCPVENCSFTSEWKSTLNIHIKVKHGDPDSLVCPVCGYVQSSKEKLSEHLETHNKAFLCPVCGKSFTGELLRNQHVEKQECKLSIINTEHEETHKKPFLCPVCGKSFTGELLRNQHVEKRECKLSMIKTEGCEEENVHKYKCVSDGHNFNSGDCETTTDKHTVTKHCADNVCPLCPEMPAFGSPECLSRHILTHDQNETCLICCHRFPLRSQLKQHMVEKHGMPLENVSENDESSEGVSGVDREARITDPLTPGYQRRRGIEINRTAGCAGDRLDILSNGMIPQNQDLKRKMDIVMERFEKKRQCKGSD